MKKHNCYDCVHLKAVLTKTQTQPRVFTYVPESSVIPLGQRTLTYFVRGNITVRLTSCLTS